LLKQYEFIISKKIQSDGNESMQNTSSFLQKKNHSFTAINWSFFELKKRFDVRYAIHLKMFKRKNFLEKKFKLKKLFRTKNKR